MAEYIKREDVLCRFSHEHGGRIPEVDENNSPNTVTIREIKHIIRDIPAANVAPVRYGRWKGCIRDGCYDIDEYGHPIYRLIIVYYCSKCRRRSVIKENYCPNCGAKMDQ